MGSHNPSTGGVDDFFNVMLIKQKGGFSSRAAVGRVKTNAWINLDLEAVDIVLIL